MVDLRLLALAFISLMTASGFLWSGRRRRESSFTSIFLAFSSVSMSYGRRGGEGDRGMGGGERGRQKYGRRGGVGDRGMGGGQDRETEVWAVFDGGERLQTSKLSSKYSRSVL